VATQLGPKLAAERAARQWTLREVEQRTGISNAHLSQVELGKIQRPSPRMLRVLAQVYELDLSELFRLGGYDTAAAAAAPGSTAGAVLRVLCELRPVDQERVFDYAQQLKVAAQVQDEMRKQVGDDPEPG